MKRMLFRVAILLLSVSLTACSVPPEETAGTGTFSTAKLPQTAPVIFRDVEVVDNDQCTVRITGLNMDSLWDCTLKVYLENKSPDKSYMMSVTAASINGVEADPYFATEVAPGKKSNQKIVFTDPFPVDIGEYTDIELAFRIYDSNDLTAEAVAETTVHVYPKGEENTQIYRRPIQPSDTVLVDNRYLLAAVTDYRWDEVWGYTAELYLVNRGGERLVVSVDEVSVNGYLVDPFFAAAVSGGSCAFASMSWPDAALEEKGIARVEDIRFLLRAHLQGDWLAEDLISEKIRLEPSKS